MYLERLAPAKVNLFLHVGPLGADGYHPICSLMTFASVGDVVRLRQDSTLSFAIEGPFRETLVADQDDNLVVRARDAILGLLADPPPPFRLTLEKRLPIAAGLGGGSSDAAATLNLLADAFGLRHGGEDRTAGAQIDSEDVESVAEGVFAPLAAPDDSLALIARRLGADVTACLGGLAVLAQGRGDVCAHPPAFPDLDAVLINPGVASSTPRVYGAFDAAAGPAGADLPEWPGPMETVHNVAAFLARCRNDLQAPAVGLQPAIGEVLGWLERQPETLFARMSGSGATCFALVGRPGDAADLASRATSSHAGWWAAPCRLAGFHP